jgi:hypothetical protein
MQKLYSVLLLLGAGWAHSENVEQINRPITAMSHILKHEADGRELRSCGHFPLISIRLPYLQSLRII